MDEGLSAAVRKVFVKLYEEGLIYQGDYIINWCHRCHTALADLEVEHEERDGHLSVDATSGRHVRQGYPKTSKRCGSNQEDRFGGAIHGRTSRAMTEVLS